jgi:hypothetical protein
MTSGPSTNLPSFPRGSPSLCDASPAAPHILWCVPCAPGANRSFFAHSADILFYSHSLLRATYSLTLFFNPLACAVTPFGFRSATSYRQASSLSLYPSSSPVSLRVRCHCLPLAPAPFVSFGLDAHLGSAHAGRDQPFRCSGGYSETVGSDRKHCLSGRWYVNYETRPFPPPTPCNPGTTGWFYTLGTPSFLPGGKTEVAIPAVQS